METRVGICLALLFVALFGHSQHRCGIESAVQNLENRQPGSMDRLHRMEAEAQDWIDQTGGTTGIEARYGWPTVTIPVVVHIVYNQPNQNLPDPQILSQIDVLNEDFRRLNADTVLTRNVFRPYAVDTKIQFCLASRDPSGNATTGITRTATQQTGFTFDDHVKFDTSGGIDAWDPAHYLNIWVCNLTTANGYAYYPNIQPAYDGIVINYNVFGRTGAVFPPYNKGRTTTHEVGHWLGLYHPFEGYFAGTGCGGSDTLTCASMGDYICDTPGDITPSYGCDTLQNSCTDTPTDFPDQIENYMDYADDACSNMFSAGQSDRMNGFLYTARSGLLTSLGCVAPGSGALDAAITAIPAPVGQVCTGTVDPKIVLANVSAVSLSSAVISYQIDGGTMSTYNWSGSLAPGATALVSLPGIPAANGPHTLRAVVSAPNSSSDANPSNDAFEAQFTTDPNGIPLMPSPEGFEASTFAPTGWRIENPDQNYYTWELSSEANGPSAPGSNAVKINNFYLGSYATHDALITPVYEGNYDLVVTYDYAYMQPNSSFYKDTLNIYWSDDCGQTWTLLGSYTGSSLTTAPNTGFAPFVPSGPQDWSTNNFVFGPLPSFSKFQFKFENASGWGNDLWLDNIMLMPTVSVTPSDHLNALQVSPNPADKAMRLTRGGMLLPAGNVELISMLGQHLQIFSVAEGTTALDLDISALPSGMYTLKYTSLEGGSASLKWMKQ